MKSRITFLSILSVSIAFVASAQEVEHDDMYFRSKDRVVLAASKPLKMQVPSKDMEVVSTINPTDSYSARNVNPEYLSQSKLSPSATNEPVSYFVPNYLPTSVNQNISSSSGYSNYANSNCNCSSLYSPYSSYYGGMSGFGSPYSNFYSPYSYGYPYGYNSFYGPGLSTGLSMTWGLGAYNPWGSSYYGMNSWGMGMNYGYGGYYGYNSGWYRPPVVIVGGGDSNGSGVVYGKRSSRSNDLNNNVTTSNRSTGTIDTQGRTRGSSSSGRITSNDSNTSGSYYQRGWRTNPETNPNRSSWSNLGRTMNDGSGAINSRSNSGSFFSDSGSRSSNWSSGNSSFSSGGGSRSSGGTSSGGSSGGARRGRD
jgi:hypothetical protein